MMIDIKQISDKALNLLKEVNQAEFFSTDHYRHEPNTKFERNIMIDDFISYLPDKPNKRFYILQIKPHKLEFSNSYNIETDIINLFHPSWFKSMDIYYSILFHEIGHSTGHKKRLNRAYLVNYPNYLITTEKRKCKEEIVAELIALFLSVYFELDDKTLIKCCKYINIYIEKSRDLTSKELVKLVKYAEKSLRYLLGIEKENNPNIKEED